MSTDRDTKRIVRSWLDEGVTALPDHVLDAVLDRIPATPQRRAGWLARRFPIMNNNKLRFGLAAAVVVALAVLGLRLLPSTNTGVPQPTPTALRSSEPTPPPQLPGGPVPGGTYRYTIGLGWINLTLPEGWEGHSISGGYVANRGDTFEDTDSVSLIYWRVTHVYADSCDWEGTLQQASTPAALAALLAAQTGHETSDPVEVTVGGYPATRIEFFVPADFDAASCDGDFLRLWPDAGPVEKYGLPIAPGQTTTVYVVDVDGESHVFGAIHWEDSAPADIAELEQVVASIRFET